MILSQNKPDYSNLEQDFGQYCKLYEKTGNKMTPRSVGDIVLRTTKDWGLYYLMSLETGIIIHVRQWTVLHVTESVIVRV